jgi:hypothetical protein
VTVGKKKKFCCTDCRIKYHRENGQARRTDWQRENGRINRAKLNQIKLDKGCAVCGYNEHPAALDFNHINPLEKSFNISEKVTNLSWKRLADEVEKCEVLCANCHRIHTHDNRHTQIRRAA